MARKLGSYQKKVLAMVAKSPLCPGGKYYGMSPVYGGHARTYRALAALAEYGYLSELPEDRDSRYGAMYEITDLGRAEVENA